MRAISVVCDTAKVRFFKQITTTRMNTWKMKLLFAILQKYDFSSKSQLGHSRILPHFGCLRYCKSTIFQANHNCKTYLRFAKTVVCDTAKVRFFKQITTGTPVVSTSKKLFAILQKYDFSSKSQHNEILQSTNMSCLRYCKSTIFQANHNFSQMKGIGKQLFAILQKYDFSSKSQLDMQMFAQN